MPDAHRIYVATEQDVVRLTLTDSTVAAAETVLPGVAPRCLVADPLNADRAYAGTFDDGLYATDDGGATWREPEHPPADDRVLALAVSLSHQAQGESVVYAGTEPSNLYRSEDGGRSWQLLPALRELPSEPQWSFPGRPWTHHVRTIALHPTDPDVLVVGIELGGVMRSLDGGATWADHNPQAHSDAHEMLTHPCAPDRVLEAAGQGVAISEDRGETWHEREQGLDRHYAWAAAIDTDDPDLWYVSVSRSPFAAHGGGDGQARLMRSHGDGWSPVDSWGDGPQLRRMPYALAALPEKPRSLLAALRGGSLLLTEDAGESWTRLEAELPDAIDVAAALAPAIRE